MSEERNTLVVIRPLWPEPIEVVLGAAGHPRIRLHRLAAQCAHLIEVSIDNNDGTTIECFMLTPSEQAGLMSGLALLGLRT